MFYNPPLIENYHTPSFYMFFNFLDISGNFTSRSIQRIYHLSSCWVRVQIKHKQTNCVSLCLVFFRQNFKCITSQVQVLHRANFIPKVITCHFIFFRKTSHFTHYTTIILETKKIWNWISLQYVIWWDNSTSCCFS